MKKRLFVAINFPSEVKSRILESIESLKNQSVRGNFTEEDNLHLTLAFIGETNRGEDIIKVMESIQSPPFDLSFIKSGKFAHNRGDLYWLGRAHNPSLFSLQNALIKGLISAGFSIEDRPFRPHVTLGREIIAKNPLIMVPETSFNVNHIDLMQSLRENGKLKYVSLYKKTL